MAKKVSVCAMLTAVCIAFSFLESQIVLLFAPGVKLGLANAVVLILFAKGHIKEGVLVNTVRILLSAFMFSGVFSLLFSLSGAFVSALAVLLFKRFKCFSFCGLSIIGATLHMLAQILVCAFVYGSLAVFTAAPVLCALSAVTGFFTGIIVNLLNKRLKNIL